MAKEIRQAELGEKVDLEALKREGKDLPELAEYHDLQNMVSGEYSTIGDMDFDEIRGLLSEEGERALYDEFGAQASSGEEIDSGFPYMKKDELFKAGPFRLIAWEFTIRDGLDDTGPKLTVEAMGKTKAGQPFRLVDSTFGIAHRLYKLTETRIKDGKDPKAAHMWLVVPGGLSQRPNPKNPLQPRYRMEFRNTEQ
jgi:hypothetical protein